MKHTGNVIVKNKQKQLYVTYKMAQQAKTLATKSDDRVD